MGQSAPPRRTARPEGNVSRLRGQGGAQGSDPEELPAVIPGATLAEADLALQHPVLRRLRSGSSIGAGARRGAAWAVGSRVASQVLQFLGTVATARLLTPED